MFHYGILVEDINDPHTEEEIRELRLFYDEVGVQTNLIGKKCKT